MCMSTSARPASPRSGDRMQNQATQSRAERALIRLLSAPRLVAVGSLLLYLCLHFAFSDSSRAGLFNYHMYLAEAFLNLSLIHI